MKTATILKELREFLSPVQVGKLEILTSSTKGSIIITLAISDIVKGYNSTRENEEKVCKLLEALCKNHFK